MEYTCEQCLEETVERDFNVSHVIRVCSACGDSHRFINSHVLETHSELEEEPPEGVEWGRLSASDQFRIAERIARYDTTRDDITMEEV